MSNSNRTHNNNPSWMDDKYLPPTRDRMGISSDREHSHRYRHWSPNRRESCSQRPRSTWRYDQSRDHHQSRYNRTYYSKPATHGGRRWSTFDASFSSDSDPRSYERYPVDTSDKGPVPSSIRKIPGSSNIDQRDGQTSASTSNAASKPHELKSSIIIKTVKKIHKNKQSPESSTDKEAYMMNRFITEHLKSTLVGVNVPQTNEPIMHTHNALINKLIADEAIKMLSSAASSNEPTSLNEPYDDTESTAANAAGSSNENITTPAGTAAPKPTNTHTFMADSALLQKSAEHVTRTLINQLTTMSKYDLKQMIDNPAGKYETALNKHAQNKLRMEVRKQLKNFNLVHAPRTKDNSLSSDAVSVDEAIDAEKIPAELLEQIGHALDLDFLELSRTSDSVGGHEQCSIIVEDGNLSPETETPSKNHDNNVVPVSSGERCGDGSNVTAVVSDTQDTQVRENVNNDTPNVAPNAHTETAKVPGELDSGTQQLPVKLSPCNTSGLFLRVSTVDELNKRVETNANDVATISQTTLPDPRTASETVVTSGNMLNSDASLIPPQVGIIEPQVALGGLSEAPSNDGSMLQPTCEDMQVPTSSETVESDGLGQTENSSGTIASSTNTVKKTRKRGLSEAANNGDALPVGCCSMLEPTCNGMQVPTSSETVEPDGHGQTEKSIGQSSLPNTVKKTRKRGLSEATKNDDALPFVGCCPMLERTCNDMQVPTSSETVESNGDGQTEKSSEATASSTNIVKKTRRGMKKRSNKNIQKPSLQPDEKQDTVTPTVSSKSPEKHCQPRRKRSRSSKRNKKPIIENGKYTWTNPALLNIHTESNGLVKPPAKVTPNESESDKQKVASISIDSTPTMEKSNPRTQSPESVSISSRASQNENGHIEQPNVKRKRNYNASQRKKQHQTGTNEQTRKSIETLNNPKRHCDQQQTPEIEAAEIVAEVTASEDADTRLGKENQPTGLSDLRISDIRSLLEEPSVIESEGVTTEESNIGAVECTTNPTTGSADNFGNVVVQDTEPLSPCHAVPSFDVRNGSVTQPKLMSPPRQRLAMLVDHMQSIDSQTMELFKRKMEIDAEIMKLNGERMEIDQKIVKMQHVRDKQMYALRFTLLLPFSEADMQQNTQSLNQHHNVDAQTNVVTQQENRDVVSAAGLADKNSQQQQTTCSQERTIRRITKISGNSELMRIFQRRRLLSDRSSDDYPTIEEDSGTPNDLPVR